MPLDSVESVAWFFLGVGMLVVVSTPFWAMILGPKFPKHFIFHVFSAIALFFMVRGKTLPACIACVPVIIFGMRLLIDELDPGDPDLPKL